MSSKTCPHCQADIPAEFGVMPICFMCGGDLSAQPSQTWTSLDIKADNTRVCPACNGEVKNILDTHCPHCSAPMPLPDSAPVAPTPEPVAPTPEPVAPTPEPVAPTPEPVAPTPEPVAEVSLPPIPPRPTTPPTPEPVETKEEAPEPDSRRKEGFFARILRLLGLKK